MRPLVVVAWLASAVSVAACGGGEEPKTPGQPSAANEASAASLAGARKRLQGSWEIVHYESTQIPKEAMPLMAELFENLKIRFDGSSAIVQRGKAPEEKTAFDVAEEQGDEFRLVANGGMFDGSKCRFLSDDEWEASDQGKSWPGVSRMKRTR